MPPDLNPLQVLFRPLVFLSGTALVATSVLVTLEVVLRRLFNASLTGADEISGYVLAAVAAWGFAYAASVRAHIRIDTLIRLVRQPYRALLDVAAHSALLAFAAVLASHAWDVLSFSLEHGSRSQTPLRVPLWIPQSIWTSGLLFFAVVTASMLALACLYLARRDWRKASDLLSADEIKEEIEQVKGADNPPFRAGQ